ncbi:VOC family protein [Glaciihabitans sp. UYNi722]|uniref:VOC family protein n=1 Tax=Glaciihabitans sp. UYNi722 TaxID=3156344 RepID=UPI00339420E6
MTTAPDQAPAMVSKIGYVGFETTDVDRMVDHYTNTLDFVLVEGDSKRAFLTTSFDHHSMVIEKAPDAKARSFVGFQIQGDLDSAENGLKDKGYAVERRSDIGPATPDVLVVLEPMTGTPIHLYDEQSGSRVSAFDALTPTKLGHVAAFTPDLAPMQAFYQDLLGFKWSDTVSDFFVFMRCNSDHHAANFMASTKFSGMHHVAFETRDSTHLQLLLDHMASRDVRLEWGPGRHGPGHNIFTYHRDPDGNNIELFTQLDTIVSEELGYFEPRPWHSDFPQRPKTWEADLATMNSWGPINFEHLER